MNTHKTKAQLMQKQDILIGNDSFFTQLTNFSNNQYHIHDFYEIFYVLEGKGRHFLNNETMPLATGDLYILRANKDCHSFSSDSGDIFIHRDIIIERELIKEVADFLSPDLFEELERSDMPFHFNLSSEELKGIETQFLHLTKQLDENKERILYKKIVVDLLSLPLLNIKDTEEKLPIWMNTLISTLNHSTHLSLTEVLQDFNYSQAYICRTFKKYMGLTMTEYFNEIKLHKAYMLLKTTDISINELVQIIGFENKTHFYRCFKSKFGKTPKEARIENKNV